MTRRKNDKEYKLGDVYKMYESGELDKYIALGIIRKSVPEYCELFKAFLMYHEKVGYLNAITLTAEDCVASEAKVRVAVAAMRHHQ